MSVTVSVDFNDIEELLTGLTVDEELRTEIHKSLRRYCRPYVPASDRDLTRNTKADADGVHYNFPYAHYQYEGVVYAPNIPLSTPNGFYGWYSPAGKMKHPTDRGLGTPGEYTDSYGNSWTFGYNKPLATHHWDEAMLLADGDKFYAAVGRAVDRYLKRKGQVENGGQE